MLIPLPIAKAKKNSASMLAFVTYMFCILETMCVSSISLYHHNPFSGVPYENTPCNDGLFTCGAFSGHCSQIFAAVMGWIFAPQRVPRIEHRAAEVSLAALPKGLSRQGAQFSLRRQGSKAGLLAYLAYIRVRDSKRSSGWKKPLTRKMKVVRVGGCQGVCAHLRI